MPFWTSALSEPRRSHRFLLSLPNLVSTNEAFRYEQYLAKSVTKPSYSVSEAEHKFLGNTYYYPGVVTWNTVQATIVNAISPDGNKILYDALANSGYLRPDIQEDVFTNPAQAPGTVNKQGAVTALGNVVIEELSGQGGLVGTWSLNNAFITEATFGDLSYEDDSLLNIEITFRYDWAAYESGPAVAAVTAL
jgi:hypothetical protein|tara:strand:+ start:742 stop:1317 length:576 start_codon:yes stop_codon:yes gene_type:complete